jgi:hypothetical protein
MADLWYAKVRPNGVVYRVYCDDHEAVQPGDIPLDPEWYWGQAPGIIISDMGHPEKYKVEKGRLVPLYDNSSELNLLREKKKQKIKDQPLSPILSSKKKEKVADAIKEAHDHIDAAINENEIEHSRIKGY